jgi:hypothetical protein
MKHILLKLNKCKTLDEFKAVLEEAERDCKDNSSHKEENPFEDNITPKVLDQLILNELASDTTDKDTIGLPASLTQKDGILMWNQEYFSDTTDSWVEGFDDVLENLLWRERMFPHHKNPKEGMDEIRMYVRKLHDFISQTRKDAFEEGREAEALDTIEDMEAVVTEAKREILEEMLRTLPVSEKHDSYQGKTIREFIRYIAKVKGIDLDTE